MESDQWIDPEIAAVLADMPPLLGELTDERIPLIRQERVAAMALLERSPDVERTDHVLAAHTGEHEVVIRVHRPKGVTGDAPCLYSIHGGGLVIGTYEMEDLRLERLCLDLGCVATSVEYRLAPETQFPGALEDCYSGLVWVHDHAAELGVDSARLGIGGASAGGGLAAGLALLARERGGPSIAFQLLVYPMLDDRASTKSSAWQVPIWNPQANDYGWRAYLGDLHGTDDVPHTAAPARATDLSELPPAFVCVGSADLFLDEDLAYAQALIHAGVPTEVHVYAGAPHGFEGIVPTADVSVRARRDIADWLRRAMAAG